MCLKALVPRKLSPAEQQRLVAEETGQPLQKVRGFTQDSCASFFMEGVGI